MFRDDLCFKLYYIFNIKRVMFTNVNITDINHSYNFVLEYSSSDVYSFGETGYVNNDGDIYFYQKGENQIIKITNNWIQNSTNLNDIQFSYKKSSFRLYCPTFAPDLYENNIKYALTINTWLNGHKITFISKIIDRVSDAIACETIKRFGDQNYYECVEFESIDPFDFIYSKSWNDFKSNEKIIGDGYDNQCESVLYITLHPVILSDENNYIKIENYRGCQNSMLLSKNPDNYLHVSFSSNINKPLLDIEPGFECSILFNNKYDDLEDYLLKNYKIKNYWLKYRVIIGKEDNIYEIMESEYMKNKSYIFSKSQILANNNFTSGVGWEPGIFVVSSVDIFEYENDEYYHMLSLISNKVAFDEKLLSFFIKNNQNHPHYVNLNIVDMVTYNINTVNKIENKIVKFENSIDSKSNIIQPTFFRSTELSNIIIHPAVTETISINLDQYKSQVEYFILQIEDISFAELGRNSTGVLFKITGKSLPNSVKSGNYYILNQDSELVTLGKYTYNE